MPAWRASAPRWFWTTELKPGKEESRSTGVLEMVPSRSETANTRWCPPAVIASTNSSLRPGSMIGVPVIPSGSMLPQGQLRLRGGRGQRARPAPRTGERIECDHLVALGGDDQEVLPAVTAVPVQ